MDFSEALSLATNGKKVTRKGWDGRGQWVVAQEGYPDGIAINANTARATGMPEGTNAVFLPYLMIRTVDGSFVAWTPTQVDLFAQDWQTLP